IHNSLIAYVQYPVVINSGSVACSLYNCTVDNATQLASGGGVYFVNSVLANITALGPYVSGAQNGFYLSPHFGSGQIPATQSPFQFGDYGSYYLTADSNFRAHGSLYAPNWIKGKTTQPPASIPAYSDVIGPLTLSPLVPRYTTGAPDLGYYYDS